MAALRTGQDDHIAAQLTSQGEEDRRPCVPALLTPVRCFPARGLLASGLAAWCGCPVSGR
ncbi:MAG: hypothetical protein ACHQCE_10005 [Streptosporangiales bacterium]